MLRLKSRQQAPPGGFQFRQRMTGWESWKVDPTTQWDFRGLCTAVQKHRRANPRFNFNTDMGAIEQEVDHANAVRVAGIPGAESYVINDAAAAPKAPAPKTLAKLLHVAESVKRVMAGADTIDEFEKSGQEPVPNSLAYFRAGACAVCPKNGNGDFTRWFTVPISDQIRKSIERKTQRGLTTEIDSMLGVCDVCLCPLKLKIWFPIEFIKTHLPGNMLQELEQVERCWIPAEINATKT